MGMVLSPLTMWLTGALLLAAIVGVVVALQRRAKRPLPSRQSSLVPEDGFANDISRNNIALTEVTGAPGLEDTSLFCDIVQRDGSTFRVQKSKLDRYEVPVGGQGLAIFVALRERDPFEERVWYLVEERGPVLHVLGLASQTHPGLVHAFEVIGRAGKQPGAVLNAADQALLKNFGWGIQDVEFPSARGRLGRQP